MRGLLTARPSTCSRRSPAARRCAVMLVLGLSLAGCGDGGESAEAPSQATVARATTTPAADAAQAKFVAQADAICAEANRKEADLGAEGPGWMFGYQFDDIEFLEPFNDAGRVALRELEQLTPPAEDREPMATMLDAIERMVKALDSRIAVLRDGRDESRAVRLYESAYTDLVTAAGRLGLTECQGILL